MNRLFGGLLLAVGILLMTVSGLCSAAVIVSGLSDAVKEPALFIYPLIFGGVPLAIGFGMFKWGRWLLREGETGALQPDQPGETSDRPSP